MERLNEELNFVATLDDTEASLNDTEPLHVELFANSQQASIYFCCVLASCVAVLIVCVPTKTNARECLIKRVKKIDTLHVLDEGELTSTGSIWCDRAE